MVCVQDERHVEGFGGHLVGFLDEAKPDVVCLQELKCQDEGFPRAEIEAAGYAVETLGQKAYNGVALVVRSSRAMSEIRRGLPGDETDERWSRTVRLPGFGLEAQARLRAARVLVVGAGTIRAEGYAGELIGPEDAAWRAAARAALGRLPR